MEAHSEPQQRKTHDKHDSMEAHNVSQQSKPMRNMTAWKQIYITKYIVDKIGLAMQV